MDFSAETTRAPSAEEELGTSYEDHEQFPNEGEQDAPRPEPEEDPRNRQLEDEDPLEKQRRREKKEFIVVLSIAFVILVIVTVTVAVLVVKNQNASGPSPHTTSPPTAAPTTFLVNDPQEKLDYLFWDVDNNNFTSGYRSVLSEKATDMDGTFKDESQHPVTRAMSWLLSDSNNQEGNLLRRLGLASVYYSNGGEGWTNTSNWLTSESHCDWHGVDCCKENKDESLRARCKDADRDAIFELNLSENNVVGNITNVFAFLQDLRSLDLSFNSLVGTLPGPLLGSLPHLFQLRLQHNQLSGTIPVSLRDNGVLDSLFLQRNNLNGTWPEAFCKPTIKFFGFDCSKIFCRSEDCCPVDDVCYYRH